MRISTVDGASGGTVDGDMVITSSIQIGNSVKISDDHTIVTDADGQPYDGELYIGHDPTNPTTFSDVKVGIGTTDPDAKLEVIGDESVVKLQVRGADETGFQPLLKLYHEATDLHAIVDPVMSVYSEWYDQTTLQIYGTGAIQINPPAGAKSEGEIRIDGNGPTYFHNDHASVGIGTSDPNSTLHANGSVAVGYREVSGDHVLTDEDCIVVVHASPEASIQRPPAASARGRLYTIKSASSGIVNVVPSDADTIEDMSGPHVLAAQYQFVSLVSTGTGWLIIGERP
jgi:hypothetical protein